MEIYGINDILQMKLVTLPEHKQETKISAKFPP